MSKSFKNKAGFINIGMTLGMLVVVIIFVSAFILFYQVYNLKSRIHQDITYIANNAILAFDGEELSYNKYKVDVNKIKDIIEDILNKNYISRDGNIKSIKVESIEFYPQSNSDCLKGRINVLHLVIRVNFRSIINIPNRDGNFMVHEDVSISLMNYGGN